MIASTNIKSEAGRKNKIIEVSSLSESIKSLSLAECLGQDGLE